MGLLKDVIYIKRMMKIGRILARHDALFIFEDLGMPSFWFMFAKPFRKRSAKKLRKGQRLVAAFQELGTSFIKLGQQLSTRSDLLDEAIVDDLRVLQDKLPPFSGQKARQMIEEEFAHPLEDIFSYFDEEAIAAASVAQVHYAQTTDGKDVAVKILRPHVLEQTQADFDMFIWVAEKIEKRRPQYKRFKPVETMKTFKRSMLLEMNFTNEAAACSAFARQFKDDDSFSVPEVDWRYTCENILTMERINAIALSDKQAVYAAGIDINKMMKNAASALFKQAFVHGFFHADLHPGNLFVHPDGRLTAVDFGIVGHLDKKLRRMLAQFLLAVLQKDWMKAAELHFELGWVDKGHSTEELARVLAGVTEPIIDRPQNEISVAQLLSRVIKATALFQMEARPELLLLEKAMIAAEGTGRYLDPSINMWMLAREPMEAWMRDNLGVKSQVKYALEDAYADFKRMPHILRKLEEKLEENHSSVNEPLAQKHKKFPWGWLCFSLLAFANMALGIAFYIGDK